MELLILSFFAGVLTILAPCVLPVLPLILGSSVLSEDKKRPYIIIGSLLISIILFTLLLKASTIFIDIPDAFWRFFSGIIILIFGIVTLFPDLWTMFAYKSGFERTSNTLLQTSSEQEGNKGSILIGMSLGPVFTSCSPTFGIILATVLPQNFAFGLINLIIYAIGLGIMLLLVAKLGRKFVSKLNIVADHDSKFKKGLGIMFIILGVIVITGLDKKIETAILDSGYFNLTNFEEEILEKSGVK